MAQSIQGLDIVFEVRTPATTSPVVAAGPWREMVCSIDDGIELDNEVNETDTKCATFSSTKKPKGTITGNAVASKALTSGQVSYKDVVKFQDDTRLLDFRIYNKADVGGTDGDVVSIQGQGQYTNTSMTGTVGEAVQFSWSFSPSGELNINDPVS